MDDQTNLNNDENLEQSATVKPRRAPTRRKTPKPLVEGINAPVSQDNGSKKIQLTDSERLLISEKEKKSPAQKPISPRATISISTTSSKNQSLTAKSSSGKSLGWLLALLIILLAGGGGYLWWMKKVGNESPDPSALVYIEPSPIPTPTPTPTPTPETEIDPAEIFAPKLTIKNTPTGYLNVRDKASTAGKQLTQVHPGETYSYSNQQNGWYFIKVSDNLEGWVLGDYVTLIK